MYATAAFNFDQGDNGWLMAEFAFMRSFFLIFLFPRIITLGRQWAASTPPRSSAASLPSNPGEFHATSREQADEQPFKAPASNRAFVFDLIFLRWSLVVDGALTTVAAFATKRWHIYLGQSTRFLTALKTN